MVELRLAQQISPVSQDTSARPNRFERRSHCYIARTMIVLPRLYAIVDASTIASGEQAIPFVKELAAAGCLVLQYRNKSGNARAMLDQAQRIEEISR